MYQITFYLFVSLADTFFLNQSQAIVCDAKILSARIFYNVYLRTSTCMLDLHFIKTDLRWSSLRRLIILWQTCFQLTHQHEEWEEAIYIKFSCSSKHKGKRDAMCCCSFFVFTEAAISEFCHVTPSSKQSMNKQWVWLKL